MGLLSRFKYMETEERDGRHDTSHLLIEDVDRTKLFHLS